MLLRSIPVIAAGAILALAAWPLFNHRGTAAVQTSSAPVDRDYLRRDALIAFEEVQARRDPSDQITRRMLASQYLQRFREQGDVGDVLRAQQMAQRSLELQPQGNTGAQMALASALLSYHEFRAALAHERAALAGEPFNDSARAQIASLLMELGRYGEARRVLAIHPRGPENPTWEAVVARYDEETGNLAGAQALIERAMRFTDSLPYAGAYDRSWYHMRAGQLAFEAGRNERSERDYKEALALFPYNSMALLWQARLYRAEKRWRPALAAATRSASIYPLPQALGYEADAQRALGDASGAHQTDELIRAEEHLFNVQGINDRLLANYYVQRRSYLGDALEAALADYRKRGDEIYADDTMAWTLAALGRWQEARTYAVRATRFDTQDSSLEYHAGVIALHTGHAREARRRLRMALALNPEFDPFDAGAARRLLSQ